MKSKKTIYLLAVLLMNAFNPLRVQAGHATGMELTYTHISGSVYKLRLIIYRDCLGIPIPSPISIHVSSISCGINQLHTLDLDTSQTTIIPLLCPDYSSTCVGGAAPGIEKTIYEKEITLSAQCPDWLFDISLASRTASITTLQNPGGEDVYVAAQLNNLNSDNNSPQFTNDPIVFVCTNQDFHYNHGMFDPDGDSISYQMVAPRSSANTPVLYQVGYAVNNPVSSNPPVSFNDFTGDLLMHTLAPEVGVIAYEIKDWRNGELMGSVVRDIMLYPVPCNANFPTATGMNGTSQQFLYVLPDDTVCFDVLSDDIDVNDTVTMTWNQTIPNATFVTNGIPHPTGTFCWIPTINDVRSQPYMFTVMVHDNACAIENACIYSYFIYVTLDSSLVWASIAAPEHQQDFVVYPNPSDGNLMLTSEDKISSIKIIDPTGRLISPTKLTGNHLYLDGPSGIYGIEIIYSDGKTHKQKLLVKK
jgi:hypothetical protein